MNCSSHVIYKIKQRMKSMKCKYVFFAIFLSLTSYAQDSKNEDGSIASIVDAKRFVFQAQSATPQRGGLKQLSFGYSVTVSPDTIVFNLPYYGRAYQATINPSDAGIVFTSTDFEYVMKVKKKGSWDISIIPKDVRNAPKAYFSITAKGYASLRVISTDKESISFNGTIEAQKQK